MNCQDCKFRTEGMSGSHHIGCDLLGSFENKVIGGKLFSMLGAFGVTASKEGFDDITLEVKGNHHGIRNGWCSWPLDFDTVWIDKCDFLSKPVLATPIPEDIKGPTRIEALPPSY